MATGDVNVQSAVHSLDQGKLAFLIRGGMVLVLILALSVLYLFVQFRGFSNPNAMDQAQIARNVASGNGYSTQYIRPVALGMMKKMQPSTESIDLHRFPDFYQSPLNPWVNSIFLGIFKGNLKMSPADVSSPGERIIAQTSVILFLLSVGVWYFVIAKIFDSRIGLLACVSVLVTDLMWQFSLSGLPQMLVLLLFSLAMLGTLLAMEAHEAELLPHTLAWIAGTAVIFGLMTLAHGLCVWLFFGWVIFVTVYFRPRTLSILTALASFLLIVTPWLVRNYQVCGNPFGLAIYDAFYESAPEQYQQRMEINVRQAGISLPGKMRINLMKQLEGIFGLLGLNLTAGAFFLAVFHPFRNPRAANMRWVILLMWIGAVIGMSLFRGAGPVSENQLHVIFIPIFAAFGLAFFFVLWSRLEIPGAIFRTIFVSVLLVACSLPMLTTILAGQKSRLQWPPYIPPFIAILGDWFNKDEVICSDMPWAVAWYADRYALLIPESARSFNRMHDYAETKQPICGLYLTPVTGNQRLFADIYKGTYKEWAPLILRPPKIEGFPFTAYTALPIEGECIIFADRDRWSQPRKTD